MPLPILQTHHEAGRDDLVRFYYKAALHWSRHLGEEAQLEIGTAITNPELSNVWIANCIFDASAPEGLGPAETLNQAIEHFQARGARCWLWMLSPGAARERTGPLAEYLLAHGYVREMKDILHLAREPKGIVQEVGGRDLKILPARASFKHMRALAEEWSRDYDTPQLADAAMLHLDDPHVDALLAIKDGKAVAKVSVMAVGEIGLIEDVFVSASFRGQGLGRTMMSRAMEICARSLFKHVLIGVRPGNAAARALYERFGFQKIGEFVEYRAVGISSAGS